MFARGEGSNTSARLTGSDGHEARQVGRHVAKQHTQHGGVWLPAETFSKSRLVHRSHTLSHAERERMTSEEERGEQCSLSAHTSRATPLIKKRAGEGGRRRVQTGPDGRRRAQAGVLARWRRRRTRWWARRRRGAGGRWRRGLRRGAAGPRATSAGPPPHSGG